MSHETLKLDTLYKVEAKQSSASIEVIGGTVDIFGSFLQPSAPPAKMYKSGDEFFGIDNFGALPTYLYITQNTGVTETILLIGFQAEEVTP